MTRALFITGTDTGVGKTRVACALLTALAARGQRVIGMKPVASGAQAGARGLRHADAEALLAASNVAADYADVNPYVFASAIAPHLAAQAAGVAIELAAIRSAYARLAAAADWVVVEGAGGWRVPLGAETSMADIARGLSLPVVLVVGLRLGCLNHALLTVEAVARDGLTLAGWVANPIDPAMQAAAATVEALATRIDAPLLARLAYGASASGFDASALAGLAPAEARHA